MQALTIHQPWAWAIAEGFKLVENRDWLPNWRLLRPGDDLAIHAGLVGPNTAEEYACKRALAMTGRVATVYPPPTSNWWRAGVGKGVVVAVATFEGHVSSRDELQADQQPWWVGKYGWRLSNVRQLEKPMEYSCRGQQGLWALPAAVEGRLQHALRAREGSLWRRTA